MRRRPAGLLAAAAILTEMLLPGGFAVAKAAPPSRFAVRGVVEGFYGPGWTAAATEHVLAFMGAHGMNTFVYAPKNDPYQRAKWQRLYPPQALARLHSLVETASRHGIAFVYSISPGLHIVYSSSADLRRLEAKIAQLRSIGVRRFMLSFDDIAPKLKDPADVAAYGGSLAAAQVDLTSALWADERRADPRFSLWFVPTIYWGTHGDGYLHGIAGLPHGVRIAWTGPGVISPRITLADARGFAAAVGRRPLLWLNFPVNDWTIPHAELKRGDLAALQPRDLFLGPLRGLAPDLASGVAGVLANPMLEPYASEIPLATVASYLNDPSGTGEAAAWRRAIAGAGGSAAAALRTFVAAEQPQPALSPKGYYIWTSTDPAADALEERLLGAAAATGRARAARRLRAIFEGWVTAAPRLRAGRLGTPGLFADLRPWVAVMPADGRAGLDALALWRAVAANDPAGVAAPRAAVERDLAAVSAQPVQFGGRLKAFLGKVLALAGPPAPVPPR